MKICTFSSFTCVCQTYFAYNFFGEFFKTMFNVFKISDTFFDFSQKNFFKVILVLFSNFEAKLAKNGAKNQKLNLVNVS